MCCDMTHVRHVSGDATQPITHNHRAPLHAALPSHARRSSVPTAARTALDLARVRTARELHMLLAAANAVCSSAIRSRRHTRRDADDLRTPASSASPSLEGANALTITGLLGALLWARAVADVHDAEISSSAAGRSPPQTRHSGMEALPRG